MLTLAAQSLLAPLLILQVGPNTAPDPRQELDLRNRPPREAVREGRIEGPRPTSDFRLCLDQTQTDPARAAANAERQLAQASGQARSQPAHCLGLARSELGDFAGAQVAFTTARDAAPSEATLYRARLGALAGNAALANGAADAASVLFAQAQDDARDAGRTDLLAGILVDRARAEVSAGREQNAVSILASAREADPANARAWLYSATLSRRQDDLAGAQEQIERAAQLSADDPLVGLEAGLIAALSGRDDAARSSWQSVLALAPGSAEAQAASNYLAQLEETP